MIHSDVSAQGSGAIIPDPPVPGAIERLHELVHSEDVEFVFIHSLRCGNPVAISAMHTWIMQRYMDVYGPPTIETMELFAKKVAYAVLKPHADVYVDDRAITFDGDWDKLSLDRLKNFKSWNR